VLINIHEAKTHLSRLVERAAAGEEIVIAKAGKPMAKLVRYREEARPRRPGLWKGKVWIAPDFDQTPEELVGLFYGDIASDQA
jgi:prevent-host-death family protein